MENQKQYRDYEPKYHFHADEWMNDGKMFFVNGEYHVFYQYKWPRHWGHTMSKDLIHWEDLPVAIFPGDAEKDPDGAGGCFTGCCIKAYGQYHIFYTGSGVNGRQTTCHAVSDDMITWVKDEANPVLEASYPYDDSDEAAWRDPCVWEYDGEWYMAQCAELTREAATELFGERVAGTVYGRSCIGLMKSPDLKTWEMLPPLYTTQGMSMYECPDVFELDGKWVTLFSCQRTYAALAENPFGKYKLNRPFPALDNDMYYAAKTLSDDKGRRLAWGFIFENNGWCAERVNDEVVWKDVHEGRKWSNVLALPRELSVDESGSLCSAPPEELKTLRKRVWSASGMDGEQMTLDSIAGEWQIAKGSIVCHESEMVSGDYCTALINEVKSPFVEIECSIDLTGNSYGKAGIMLRAGEELEDVAIVAYDMLTNSVSIEDSRATLGAPHSRIWECFTDSPFMPVSIPVAGVAGKVDLRIFLDSTVIEVFINGKMALSGRCYPHNKSSVGIGFFSNAEQVRFDNVKMWEL